MTALKQIKTVQASLEAAIEFERIMGEIYAKFAKIFADQQELAQLWASMREDELVHAQILESVHEKLLPEQKAAPAPQKINESIEYLYEVFTIAKNQNVQTFDEAYNVAHDFEFSEVNTVFKFLATELVADYQHPDFLDNQVDQHLYKLLNYKQKMLEE